MTDTFIKNKKLHAYLAVLFVSLQTLHFFKDEIAWSLITEVTIFGLALSIAILLLQHVVIRRVFSDAPSMYTLLTLSVISFLLWEPIVNTVRLIFGLIRERHIVLIFGFILLTISIILFLLRKKKLSTLTVYLNVLFITLSIVEAYHLIISNHKPINISEKKPTDYSQKPDIFLILLDGYSNPHTSRKYFGFDNNGLIDSLSQKGFYIAKNSTSNYKFTVQTVASMLNMDYLRQPLPELLAQFKSINNNTVTKSLTKEGYQFTNLSIFSHANQPAPFLLESYSPKSFEYRDLFLSRTIVGTYLRNRSTVILNDNEVHKKTLHGFQAFNEQVANIETSQPQFVYLHSLVSHGPFWMDSSAQYSDKVVLRNKTFANAQLVHWHDQIEDNNHLGNEEIEKSLIEDYRNHLYISNDFALKSVNSILKNRPNSIILVMSDHGFRFLMRRSLEETKAEQYSNLCTIYFPDKKYEKLYDSITPVNLFRATLNNALGTNLAYLEDKTGL